MAQSLYKALLKFDIRAVFRYVPSKWNPSDGLTRAALKADFERATKDFDVTSTTARLEAVDEMERFFREQSDASVDNDAEDEGDAPCAPGDSDSPEWEFCYFELGPHGFVPKRMKFD